LDCEGGGFGKVEVSVVRWFSRGKRGLSCGGLGDGASFATERRWFLFRQVFFVKVGFFPSQSPGCTVLRRYREEREAEEWSEGMR